MTVLDLRPVERCHYDLLSLGEVMLRLDPGESRISGARSFDVWEGGGEYNVARGLKRVFGLRAGVVTALVSNPVGHLVEGLILAGGVDTSLIQWQEDDGVGRSARNGLNFTERGFGVRGAVGVSDRANTAASKLRPEDVDWDHIFGDLGVRWLHTGGIYAALSETSARTVLEAVQKAREYGTIVSYDLNYRPSLWKAIGGRARAQEVNREIAQHVDVMIGNEEDFTAALGFDVEGQDGALTNLEVDNYVSMIDDVRAEFSNLQVIGTTLRTVHTASRNDWGAIAWSQSAGLVQARHRVNLEILDRVGGGDSFASGLIYGLMSGESLQVSVDLGAAHGALAMTTPGDTSQATRAEVLKLASGGNARVQR